MESTIRHLTVKGLVNTITRIDVYAQRQTLYDHVLRKSRSPLAVNPVPFTTALCSLAANFAGGEVEVGYRAPMESYNQQFKNRRGDMRSYHVGEVDELDLTRSPPESIHLHRGDQGSLLRTWGPSFQNFGVHWKKSCYPGWRDSRGESNPKPSGQK